MSMKSRPSHVVYIDFNVELVNLFEIWNAAIGRDFPSNRGEARDRKKGRIKRRRHRPPHRPATRAGNLHEQRFCVDRQFPPFMA